MSKEEILKSIEDVMHEVFNDSNLEINQKTSSQDIEDWDSLEHINITVSLEKKFHIKFDFNEVSEIINVGEMLRIIDKKINN